MESLRILHVPSPPCLTYYSGVLFGNDDHKKQLVQRMVALEFTVLTLDTFFRTVRHGVTSLYH